ncbi:tryptophan 2,3-dioxygenase family protein [Gynurincola endophyticus]|jgi:tryptophan 2,3-dioxygenase|uniref:tryptophan 2,3-dioxygenase family protein n=1 Tax=Gynurincola endophyticus TaxID=2479004 RepID=UPI000F8C5DB5|nr:tryptophan 2,3-dioxygenase family protein [Gynurincola endophyticus]
MSKQDVHYSDYLELDKILNAQFLESDKAGTHAHDEMLFIVIHQAYELWFKQLLFEADSVVDIMKQEILNDNSPELQTVEHRLSRMVTILKLLVQQIDVMETMTPMDFLDFRDLLRPASGFQSWQFKILEAKLGLRYQHRFGQEYYISQLRPAQVEMIKSVEAQKTLLELLNTWLERMPFFEEAGNWQDYQSQYPHQAEMHPFWSDYQQAYMNSLSNAEAAHKEQFSEVFFEKGAGQHLSAKASRAALFIMLYRGYPMLHLPFQVLNQLLEIDEQLSTWRYRHMSMVHRIIGTRIGTGGSTGKEYLKGALDKHYIFADIARLTSFLIERRHLPKLSVNVEKRLGFLQ